MEAFSYSFNMITSVFAQKIFEERIVKVRASRSFIFDPCEMERGETKRIIYNVRFLSQLSN